MARWISPRGTNASTRRHGARLAPPAGRRFTDLPRPPNPNRAKYNTIHTTQESSSLSSLSVRLFPHIWSGMARGSSASMCGGSAWIGNAEKRILCAGNAHELKQYVMKSAK
ncbi:hypothetical protein niasHS_011438 [Heterodera schachtii]|uniref:Uncharacterized protein n=2 Tax=Heterodera TaxID=34509 RepID=A0ABD2IUR6_HETSC